MTITTYGLDLAKRIFQLYWVGQDTGEINNRKFDRVGLIEFFSNRPVGRVALEACGSANWWGRKLKTMGHEVILLHARFLRPFAQNNKTDAADAKAIWTAENQPGMRTVTIKTEEQQAILALHRICCQLVKSHTAQVNQLRGADIQQPTRQASFNRPQSTKQLNINSEPISHWRLTIQHNFRATRRIHS